MTNMVLAILGLALFIAPGAVAQGESHGRISFADESGLIKGQEDTDWSYAALNSLVMPGDTIWADDNGALEIEFSGGTFVRLADGSRINVLDVPPNGLIRGDIGSFYIQRVSRSNGDMIFDSPVGSIIVEPDTQVRIDILDGGATTVSVRWGRALVHTADSASVSVNAGARTFIDPGYLPSDPITFDRSQEDSFDTWNRERGRYLAQGNTPAPIDYGASAPLGVSELGSYGEWVYVDNTPYWRPTVVVDYVPYRYGSWSYIPRHGYVWCDNYPFAYTTTHYGYWRHHHRHGWIWSYSGHYRPAYAYTVSYGDYFVWAPLGYDGYPVYSTAYAGFTIGSVNFSFGWSSYAYHRDVFHCRPSVFAVHYNLIYDSHRRHHHHDHNYWRIEADARPYRDAGRPHWPGGRTRSYQPDEVYRGVTLASNTNRPHAADRARQLESRRPERTNRSQVAATRPTRTTPVDRTMRSAAVRDARVNTPSIDRVARNNDRTAPGVANGRTRTYNNDNARGADPLSRGSVQNRPIDPSDRRNVNASPRGRDERSLEGARQPSRPVDPSDRTQRTNVTDRTERPTARPVVPNRPTATRPEVGRPSTDATAPRRPTTERGVGDRATRPKVIRPNPNTNSTQRPTVDRGTRDSVTRPEVIRPNTSVNRPQNATPQRPTVSPNVTRRQVTTVQRPTATRPSSPSRQQVSQPARPSAPSRQQFSQPSRPSQPSRQTYSPPSRNSSPAPSFSSPPRPSSSSPRVSAPSRPSSPSPRVSAPSRSSAPSVRSAPPSSSRGSSSAATRGSSRSGRGNN